MVNLNIQVSAIINSFKDGVHQPGLAFEWTAAELTQLNIQRVALEETWTQIHNTFKTKVLSSS